LKIAMAKDAKDAKNAKDTAETRSRQCPAWLAVIVFLS